MVPTGRERGLCRVSADWGQAVSPSPCPGLGWGSWREFPSSSALRAPGGAGGPWERWSPAGGGEGRAGGGVGLRRQLSESCSGKRGRTLPPPSVSSGREGRRASGPSSLPGPGDTAGSFQRRSASAPRGAPQVSTEGRLILSQQTQATPGVPARGLFRDTLSSVQGPQSLQGSPESSPAQACPAPSHDPWPLSPGWETSVQSL